MTDQLFLTQESALDVHVITLDNVEVAVEVRTISRNYTLCVDADELWLRSTNAHGSWNSWIRAPWPMLNRYGGDRDPLPTNLSQLITFARAMFSGEGERCSICRGQVSHKLDCPKRCQS